MSFTTQSESVPVVDTRRLGTTGPATVTSRSSGSVWYVRTSVRVAAKRWSSTMCSRVMPGDCPLI